MGDVLPAVESEGTAAKGQKCPRSACIDCARTRGACVPGYERLAEEDRVGLH